MTCPKCKDGLIPFVKNGKVVPHAWLDCECKQQVEHYQPLTPDMFDFPMSDTFRGFSYEYCNQPDPGYIPPEQEASATQVIEHRHYNIPEQGYVKYLQEKLAEREKRKPRKPSGYKGIK